MLHCISKGNEEYQTEEPVTSNSGFDNGILWNLPETNGVRYSFCVEFKTHIALVHRLFLLFPKSSEVSVDAAVCYFNLTVTVLFK